MEGEEGLREETFKLSLEGWTSIIWIKEMVGAGRDCAGWGERNKVLGGEPRL